MRSAGVWARGGARWSRPRWRRFIEYGLVGWLLEVMMTGVSSALIQRDASARGHTFLWMLPIYGTGGVLIEALSGRVGAWPRAARALAYLPVIYGVEYGSGWMLRRALGRCPWDYGCGGQGPGASRLVRIDYAPLWFMVALLFEPVRDGFFVPARHERATL
jgi:hypothetical protein